MHTPLFSLLVFFSYINVFLLAEPVKQEKEMNEKKK